MTHKPFLKPAETFFINFYYKDFNCRVILDETQVILGGQYVADAETKPIAHHQLIYNKLNQSNKFQLRHNQKSSDWLHKEKNYGVTLVGSIIMIDIDIYWRERREFVVRTLIECIEDFYNYL